jgi:hypothetical protein
VVYTESITELLYSLAESGSIKWWWLDDALESIIESNGGSDYRGEYYNKRESITATDIDKSTSIVGKGLLRRTLTKSVSAVNDGYWYAKKSTVDHRRRARKWFRQRRFGILLKRKQFRKTAKHRRELKKRKQAAKRNKTLTGTGTLVICQIVGWLNLNTYKRYRIVDTVHIKHALRAQELYLKGHETPEIHDFDTIH